MGESDSSNCSLLVLNTIDRNVVLFNTSIARPTGRHQNSDPAAQGILFGVRMEVGKLNKYPRVHF